MTAPFELFEDPEWDDAVITMHQRDEIFRWFRNINDGHPDPLVISSDYPEPLPGWSVITAVDKTGHPLLLRVVTTTPRGDPKVVPSGYWFHPDPEYATEVARQLVTGERRGMWVDTTSHHNTVYSTVGYARTVRLWTQVDARPEEYGRTLKDTFVTPTDMLGGIPKGTP